MQGEIIEITWEDSHMWGPGWMDQEIESFQLAMCESCGCVIAETKELILLRQSKSDDGNIANLIAIPRACIKSIKRVKEWEEIA